MTRIYDAEWARLSAKYLAENPICAVQGCGKPAEHCDHIETVKSAPHRRLDWTNLEGLCHSHHNILTKAYDAGSIRGACDVDGEPIDPSHPWAQTDNAAAIRAANSVTAPSGRLAARLKRSAALGREPPPVQKVVTGKTDPPPVQKNRRGRSPPTGPQGRDLATGPKDR